MTTHADVLLVVDAGTGSVRAIVFDLQGRQLSVAQAEWTHRALPEHPGSQDFDTAEAWRLVCACTRRALGEAAIAPERVIGVTATSMREGFVLYDGDGREIWACPNVDARARAEAAEMAAEGLGEELYRVGGDWLSLIAPPRLRWIERHQPDVHRRARKIGMLSDWVLFRLSGELATDPSNGSSSGLFDLAEGVWSRRLAERLGIPEALFPPVRASGSRLGAVAPGAAEQSGLRAGTPVFVGGGDTQLGLVGVGAVAGGRCVVVGGTFWQTTLVVDRPLVDPERRLRTLCHAVPGQWMIEGIGFYCGLALRWFRDAFCPDLVARARDAGQDPYADMERLASLAPPGAGGVLALFSDAMNARRWKHAAPSFVQFDVGAPSTSGRKEAIRALLESAAYVSYANLENLTDVTGRRPEEITFCGGAAKGELWPQIVADVHALPVRVPRTRESTALGGAMGAAVGAGAYPDLAAAAGAMVRWERTHQPRPEAVAAYQEHYRRWRRVYPRFLELVDEGLLAPMWQAPGT